MLNINYVKITLNGSDRGLFVMAKPSLMNRL